MAASRSSATEAASKPIEPSSTSWWPMMSLWSTATRKDNEQLENKVSPDEDGKPGKVAWSHHGENVSPNLTLRRGVHVSRGLLRKKHCYMDIATVEATYGVLWNSSYWLAWITAHGIMQEEARLCQHASSRFPRFPRFPRLGAKRLQIKIILRSDDSVGL